MTSTKKKVNSLWCVMTIQTEKETKRSGLTLYNLPVTKKKKLVMSLHNTSKNTFFFVENKINRLVVR